VHHLQLPVHRAAYQASVALECIAAEQPDQLWEAVDTLFLKQSLFSNTAVFNSTESEIRGIFANIGKMFGVGPSTMSDCFLSSASATRLARQGFRYALQRGGLGGTPAYSVNGVILEAHDVMQWTAAQWIQFLDAFFAPEAKAAPANPRAPASPAPRDMETLVQLDCVKNPAACVERADGKAKETVVLKASQAALQPALVAESKMESGCSEEEDFKAPCPRVRKSESLSVEASATKAMM